MQRPTCLLPHLVLASLLSSTPLFAQVNVTPLLPQVGSSNPASPEPLLVRPKVPPCTVALLTEQPFADFSNKPLTYTPPADCHGPWAKVIFSADFTVTAGRQYDRTAKFFLGGANIYFGTTAEPRSNLSPSWHVERDVTDLSALFQAPQVGQAILGNFVGVYAGVTYNGIIYVNARLDFYPAATPSDAPAVPDGVLPFPLNDTKRVSTTKDSSAGAFVFPRNLERVYLDVIAQSQSSDEFWYTCVPSDVAAALQNCGNTAFRETEVAIDNKPAGVAPVYPWIYTGGIDPYLWEPIPGVETLNLKPYRVDLTPFAGLLADGVSHTVSVSVFNAGSGFDVASTLLLYTDHGAAVTGGALTSDTLSTAPTPDVQESLRKAADGTVEGTVTVQSTRAYTLSGYVLTSRGRVETTLQASTSFSNLQDEKVSNTEYKQNLQQETKVQEVVTTRSRAGSTQTQHNSSFPLVVDYRQANNSDGSFYATTYVKQGKEEMLRGPRGSSSADPVVSNEVVESTDTLHYSAAGAFLGHDHTYATASYGAKDAQHHCFFRSLKADSLVLTHVATSDFCSLAP